MKVGIAGYGNLGRGVEAAVTKAEDMELVAVFTRRDPAEVSILRKDVPVLPYSRMADMKDKIDVIICCMGSATDLPEITPEIAGMFNVVDSFDTHADIPRHMAAVDKAASAAGKIGLISAGWDPGLFSIARVYAKASLPAGNDYTFWGKGVSQGHSDAIRRIEGVVDARQYTIPVEAAVEAARGTEAPQLSVREKHTRECFVVAEEGADKERIRQEIVTMPHYFDEYDTTVHFIDQEEMKRDHSGLPHGGVVLRSGNTGMEEEFHNTVEFRLQLDSNPFFTASVLTAVARATVRMNRQGISGARTVLDIPPVLLLPESRDQVVAHML